MVKYINQIKIIIDKKFKSFKTEKKTALKNLA